MSPGPKTDRPRAHDAGSLPAPSSAVDPAESGLTRRRVEPWPLDPITLKLPRLPPELEGLRIAHVSDLHVTRPRRRHTLIARALANSRADVVALTGDLMTRGACLETVVSELEPIFRAAGQAGRSLSVLGNHDSDALRRGCEGATLWLDNQSVLLPMKARVPADPPPPSIRVDGLDQRVNGPADAVAMTLSLPLPADVPPFRLMLCHRPVYLPVAADLGVDLMLSGHSHGGQLRPLPGVPLFNGSDMPRRLTSGLLRQADTLCAVSRGLGEVNLPLRLFCRPHLPVYELRRGPLPGHPSASPTNVHPW